MILKLLNWLTFYIYISRIKLKASEPKWVNSNYNLYGVNSLRLGGLRLMYLITSRKFVRSLMTKNLTWSYLKLWYNNVIDKWRPPNQSKLTPMIFNMGLAHLGLETSKYCIFKVIYSTVMLSFVSLGQILLALEMYLFELFLLR